MTLTALAFLCLAADAEPSWKLAAEDDGIKVYSRQKEGQNVAEMKAIGLIDASPQEIWKPLRDYPNYKTSMPYTEVSKVLGTEGDGKTTWFYTVINAPLVDRRDYVLKLTDESDWKDGAGFLKCSWTAWNETDRYTAPKRDDAVRLTQNDGYWLLEPREKGTKTFVTYYVNTDPGGSIPKWIANKANNTAVPNVFKALKKAVADERARAEKK